MARAFAAAAAAVLAALVVVLPASGGQAPRRPALQLVSLAPLAVTGRNFAPRETALVTYQAVDGSSRLVSARATRSGRFRAVFRLRVGRCDSFTVRAIGTAGSRAILQVERNCDGRRRGPPKRAPKEPEPGED
jgi:hypothetical protein